MKNKTEIAKNRIIWLHEMIKGGSFPNAQRECEMFGISEAQAHRDIKALRERLGAPLEFDRGRNGFRYSEPYTLPDLVRSTDTEDSVSAIASSEENGGVDAQMIIPYMAVVEIPTKLGAMCLGKYIKKKAGKNRYFCEFRNPALFLGMLLASGEQVSIKEPEWLRAQLEESCRRLLEANAADGEKAD